LAQVGSVCDVLMVMWLAVVGLVHGLTLKQEPGCETVEATASSRVQECKHQTEMFEAQRDQYNQCLDELIAQLEPRLEYWQGVAGAEHDDFHGNDLLGPPGFLLHNPNFLVVKGGQSQIPGSTGCADADRMYEDLTNCNNLLTTGQLNAKKSIEFKEGLISDKRERIRNYQEMVRRMRSFETGESGPIYDMEPDTPEICLKPLPYTL